ncbi:MAG: Chitinase [Chthonomonadaceae bacterium]|nr:Chitinase [Chthonomonadaceae bacterium]
MFLTSLYRGLRLALLACTLAFVASAAFAQSGQLSIPTAPTNPVATTDNVKVSLSWKRVSGATSYIVYRSTSSGNGYKLIGTPTGLNVVDTHVFGGTTYYYAVTAVNARGESPKSAEVSAMPPIPANAPATPANVVATAGNAKVSLSWSLVSGANSYIVYRSTTSGNGYKLIGTPTGPNGVDTRVTNGTTYYYVVTAVNARGESPKSAQVSATAPTPQSR